MATEKEIEIQTEIATKGLVAPRITPDHIDSRIAAETYYVFPGTTLTVCALTLLNGFIVTGESAAASPENFDADIGKRIARDNARNKIWALEGYLLKEKLYVRTTTYTMADAEADLLGTGQEMFLAPIGLGTVVEFTGKFKDGSSITIRHHVNRFDDKNSMPDVLNKLRNDVLEQRIANMKG